MVTWRYLEESLRNTIEKIWKEEGIPQEWKSGIISPLYKKGSKKEYRNYRLITLMGTGYMIYANILRQSRHLGHVLREKKKDCLIILQVLKNRLQPKSSRVNDKFKQIFKVKDREFLPVQKFIMLFLWAKHAFLFLIFLSIQTLSEKVEGIKICRMIRRKKINKKIWG